MEYTLDYAAIGRRIRKIRKERRLTQAALGERCGVTSAHIGHIEKNHGKLSLAVLVNIANTLEVSLDELMCDSLVSSKPIYEDELQKLLSQATVKQVKMITELARVVLRDEFKPADHEQE